ncbi:hypothetical protein [Streptomyces sp. NPDC006879]|uniref:hypothetical protein n=1 Tax=Streptomyces sp. NPDC006879 TaxID=3364767 RepID=UPI0036BF4D53
MNDAEERSAARLTVAGHATTAEELALFLEMLGLEVRYDHGPGVGEGGTPLRSSFADG